MSSVEPNPVYAELVDALVENADIARLSSFRISEVQQERLDDLLEKNREGTLTDRDKAELATFEQVEHLTRLVKARLLQKRDS